MVGAPVDGNDVARALCFGWGLGFKGLGLKGLRVKGFKVKGVSWLKGLRLKVLGLKGLGLRVFLVRIYFSGPGRGPIGYWRGRMGVSRV